MSNRPFSSWLLAACLGALLAGSICASGAQTRQYRVAKGDTLSRVARKYGLSVAALAAANGIPADSDLHVGAKLSIPTKGAPATAAAAPRAVSATPGRYTV